MPVSVCPVSERPSRAPPGRPRPRVRATPAPHSSPRGSRRKDGRQRQTRRADVEKEPSPIRSPIWRGMLKTWKSQHKRFFLMRVSAASATTVLLYMGGWVGGSVYGWPSLGVLLDPLAAMFSCPMVLHPTGTMQQNTPPPFFYSTAAVRSTACTTCLLYTSPSPRD